MKLSLHIQTIDQISTILTKQLLCNRTIIQYKSSVSSLSFCIQATTPAPLYASNHPCSFVYCTSNHLCPLVYKQPSLPPCIQTTIPTPLYTGNHPCLLVYRKPPLPPCYRQLSLPSCIQANIPAPLYTGNHPCPLVYRQPSLTLSSQGCTHSLKFLA